MYSLLVSSLEMITNALVVYLDLYLTDEHQDWPVQRPVSDGGKAIDYTKPLEFSVFQIRSSFILGSAVNTT